MAAGKRVKEEGAENDLLDRIAKDDSFNMTKEQLLALMKPENFTGCAEAQTENFLNTVVNPIIEASKDALGMHADITV